MIHYLLAVSFIFSHCVNGGVVKNETDNTQPVVLILKRIGNSYYYVPDLLSGNYFQGIQFCNYHDMELVSIETEKEDKEIFKLLRSYYGWGNHGMWTSGTSLPNDKQEFYWLSTGEKLQYLGWRQGEPNNIGNYEKCLVANFDKDKGDTLLWNDMDCNEPSYIICEKRLPENSYSELSKDETKTKQYDLKLRQFRDSYYYVENILQAKYSDAEQFCKNLDMKFVSIDTVEERKFLFDQLKSHYGIASNDLWASGKPLDSNQHDSITFGDKMDDKVKVDYEDDGKCLYLILDEYDETIVFDRQNCNRRKRFICERNATEHI